MSDLSREGPDTSLPCALPRAERWPARPKSASREQRGRLQNANFPAVLLHEGWRMEESPPQGRFFMHSRIINEPAQCFFPLALIVVAHCIKYIKSFFLKPALMFFLLNFLPGAKSGASDITATQNS